MNALRISTPDPEPRRPALFDPEPVNVPDPRPMTLDEAVEIDLGVYADARCHACGRAGMRLECVIGTDGYVVRAECRCGATDQF